tara:strand:+ start:11 stop:199 length:189 start_codon:yes stop_codon:yes gene_type:complete
MIENIGMRRSDMIVTDIAEWIANLFILGLAGIIWVIVIFGAMMIISIINKWIKDIIKNNEKE